MTRFCDNCGHQLKDENAQFCDNCGSEIKMIKNNSTNQTNPNIITPVKEKSKGLAILISLFLPGLGVAYAGDTTKGLIILACYIVAYSLSLIKSVPTALKGIAGISTLIIWIIGLVLSYQEANKVNELNRINAFQS